MSETIFEALRDDHQVQRKLVDAVVDTQGDSTERSKLFSQLKDELVKHASAEERFLYKPMLDFDETQEKARHSIAEHHEIDELIESLEATNPSSPAWKATAEKLQHTVHHHLDEEEQEVFQQAGKVLSEQKKTSLAQSYREQMGD
jgi:hemerythrin superfamily protein